jgi:hypothetical protein
MSPRKTCCWSLVTGLAGLCLGATGCGDLHFDDLPSARVVTPAQRSQSVSAALMAEETPAAEPTFENRSADSRLPDQADATKSTAADDLQNPQASGGRETGVPPQEERRKFAVQGPEQAVRIKYEDLDLHKLLNVESVPINVVNDFPDWLRQLNGQRVRIRGFMYPVFQETGIEQFVLTRDTGPCCFGPDPRIDYLVTIRMRAGKTANYIPTTRPFDVHGVFRIEPVVDGDKLLGLYSIEDALVIDR